ncbi:hypothetical protein E2C01_101162 [Portunus trituberculatus]|uniref:Uncharacterized protein n=1 Tax=Portunus trituberculatus TaxID=210409 RepID=A0A5B7K511_PORTR|nr:hypothetical protein [Portunus trituberculatus]
MQARRGRGSLTVAAGRGGR